MNQVRFVPIDQIIVTNDYLRLDTRIEELKKSIQAIGLIHPLIINQQFELIAGGRRYSALKSLGIEEIPVVVVERDELAQELISIDENLMRLPLKPTEMEKALNRGREIYETLYPEAKKVETTPDPIDKKATKAMPTEVVATDPPPNEEKVDGKASYVEVTAAKTGLTEGAIRSAIIRDERSSDQVKAARIHGEIGASQTNEIVKLDKEVQDQLLPVVKDMSTKELRRVIKEVKKDGIEATIEKIENTIPTPKLYAQFLATAQKLNRLCAKIILEELPCQGKETFTVIEMAQQGLVFLDELITINAPPAPAEPEDDEDDVPEAPAQLF